MKLPPRTTPRVAAAVKAAGGRVRNMIATAPRGKQWVAYGYHTFEVPPPDAAPEVEAESLRKIAMGLEPAVEHTFEGTVAAAELLGATVTREPESGVYIFIAPDDKQWVVVHDPYLLFSVDGEPEEDWQELIDSLMSDVREGFEPRTRRR